MLSIIYDIIKEGIINNKSSLKIINNEPINEITIITNNLPIFVYEKIDKQKYSIKLLSIKKNDVLFSLNDNIIIILTNIIEKIHKINIYNIQIDIKTKNILNNTNEINIAYADIYEYPILLLEIIELLCYEKYHINTQLKNYIDENISVIFVNFQHKMINNKNDIMEIIYKIDKKSHYNIFLKLITNDYIYIYEIIFGIKYNIELFEIIKPHDIKTLLLFILIDKDKLFYNNVFEKITDYNIDINDLNTYINNNKFMYNNDNYDDIGIKNSDDINDNETIDDIGIKNSDDNDSEDINDNEIIDDNDSETIDDNNIETIDDNDGETIDDMYNDDDNYNNIYIDKLDKINEIKKIKSEMVKMEIIIKKNKFYNNIFILNGFNIIKILTLKNIELSLKVGYVIKNFLNIDISILKYCVNIYNLLSLDKINENIFKIIYDEELIKYIDRKHLEIPIIVNNFKKNIDSIDIYIFQDCFIILCEELYIHDYNNYNEVFEKQINGIRDYKKDYIYKLKYNDEKIKYKKLKELYKLIKKNKKRL